MNTNLNAARLSPDQMLEDLKDFCFKIEKLANEIGLNLIGLKADHIALRINEQTLAEESHKAWGHYGKEISSAVINGRPIIVIEFDKRLEAFGFGIECLELPYPAEGKQYPQQGWEHVEFVVPSKASEADEYLQDLYHHFPALAENWPGLSEQGINTKLSCPKGEGERLSNPTVAFKKDGICIKLHPWSLKEIVESEKS